MKKVIKIIVIVIASIILLGTIFGIVDYNRAKNEKLPIFAIHLSKNKITQADLYYGLGYVIVKCPTISKDSSFEVNDYIKFQILDTRHMCVSSIGVIDEEE